MDDPRSDVLVENEFIGGVEPISDEPETDEPETLVTRVQPDNRSCATRSPDHRPTRDVTKRRW